MEDVLKYTAVTLLLLAMTVSGKGVLVGAITNDGNAVLWHGLMFIMQAVVLRAILVREVR